MRGISLRVPSLLLLASLSFVPPARNLHSHLSDRVKDRHYPHMLVLCRIAATVPGSEMNTSGRCCTIHPHTAYYNTDAHCSLGGQCIPGQSELKRLVQQVPFIKRRFPKLRRYRAAGGKVRCQAACRLVGRQALKGGMRFSPGWGSPAESQAKRGMSKHDLHDECEGRLRVPA